MKLAPMFPAFLAAMCFALSAICARRTSRLVGSIAANCARLWVAGIMLAFWAHGFGRGWHGAGWPVFVLSGVVGFGIGDLAMFAALPLLGSRLTALMVQCLAAPMAALIEWLWLGTKLDAQELYCGGVILAGVAIAVAPEKLPEPIPTNHHATTARERSLGLLFGSVAALGQAGGAVTSRKAHALSQAGGWHIDGGTAAYQRATGGLLVVTAVYLWSRSRPHKRKGPPPQWKPAFPWIIANSITGAAIGVSCYQWALATTPSAVVLPIVALTPLVVVPFAYFIDHERPSARSLCGGVLAVAAAAVLAHSR